MSASSDRAVERRARDRRDGRRSAFADESWFGAFSSDQDTLFDDEGRSTQPATAPQPIGAYTSHFEQPPPAPRETDKKPPDNKRFLLREAKRMVESGQTAFVRLYRAFIAARAALSLALVIAMSLATAFGQRPSWPVAIVTSPLATACRSSPPACFASSGSGASW